MTITMNRETRNKGSITNDNRQHLKMPAKMVEVFDSKTNKNVFVSKDKVLEEKDRYEPKN
jgi:hypothetical protein